MARPRAAPGTECETVRCGRAGCVAVEGEGSCALGDDYLGSDRVSRYCPDACCAGAGQVDKSG
jgi:hypothetical protein